jgi:aerobic carbon-monoxide dehydrogenase large subunit
MSASEERIYIPRIHVASIETCGCVADWDRSAEQLTLHMTTQAPHAIRTVLALVAGRGAADQRAEHPGQSPDIGGGFGGKVPVYPGYVLAVAASFLIGKPVKWIEDRGEPAGRLFARDYHIDAELAATKDGKIRALQVKTIADHGYTDAAANPSKFPAGLFNVMHRLLRLPGRVRRGRRVYTNKPPGRRRLPLLVPGDRGGAHAIERMVDVWPTRSARTRRAAVRELHPTGAVPLSLADRLGVRLAATTRGAAQGAGHHRTTTGCARSRPRSAPAAS